MIKSQYLVWNVYIFSSPNQNLRVFNVFDHPSFSTTVAKLLKADMSKEDFATQLRRDVQYYYCGQCEWESIITDIRPCTESREIDRLIKFFLKGLPCRCSPVRLSHAAEIDVSDQLCLNWDAFVDYVWSYSKSQRE